MKKYIHVSKILVQYKKVVSQDFEKWYKAPKKKNQVKVLHKHVDVRQFSLLNEGRLAHS